MLQKLLVLDDEPEVLETTSALFELEGYEVITAKNGLEALEQASHDPPALALLDIRMEPMTGVEVLAELKKRRPDLPVIMVTAYSGEHLEQAAYKLGAYALVRKPFDVSHLLTVVQRAVAKTNNID
jgi:CheY-like chemotaxis protein